MRQYLGEWQRKQGVEKTHLLVLTDGESQCLGYTKSPEDSPYFDRPYVSTLPYNTVVRDNGRYHTGIENANSSATAGLLKIIRAAYPQCSVMGFRICQNRSMVHYLHVLGIWDTDKYSKDFSKNKSTIVYNSPYNELYVLKSNSYSSDTEMEVADDATKTQIKSAFRKSLKSKSVNRRMLSSFAGQIA